MRLAVLSLLCLFAACFQEPPADRMWRCTVDKTAVSRGPKLRKRLVRQGWDGDARSFSDF